MYVSAMQEVSMQHVDRTQVSLRVPNDLLADFDRLAEALDRDRTWVMLRAMRSFVESEGAAILDEAEGAEELNRGEGVDFEDLLVEARAMLAAKEAGTA
jgi:predicted transcriptional regulator